MIPKIIHYCWFGRGEKSPLMKKCIKSWAKYCPDYQVIEWNEDNFDIDSVPWTKEAYECRKWAFITDYVRLVVLKEYGGIYMDTDIELLQPLDNFLVLSAFSGFENASVLQTGIMAAEKNHPAISRWLSFYDGRHYIVDGNQWNSPNVNYITDMMRERGLIMNNTRQIVDDMTIFPKTVFCPLDMYDVRKDDFTKETVVIHHFTSTWRTEQSLKQRKQMRFASSPFGRFLENIRAYWKAFWGKITGRSK